MKKFAIRSLITAVIFYGVFFVLDNWYTKKILAYSPEKLNWIMRLDKGNYDFAVVGSSRVESMVDIKTITGKTGLSGLNLGLNGTSINETSISTYHFLKHNKCKVLFIHIDVYQFTPRLTYSYPFHEYKYIPYFGDSITDAIVKDNVNDAKYYAWRAVPFWAYAEFNTEFNVLDVRNNFKGKEHPYDEFGSRTSPNVPGAAVLYDKRWDAPRPEMRLDTNILDVQAIKYFNTLIQICKQNGTIPVLYTPPTYYKAIANNRDSKNEINALCAKYGIRYLDMSNVPLVKDATYFQDYTHLNGHGCLEYSKYLADSISNLMKVLNVPTANNSGKLPN